MNDHPLDFNTRKSLCVHLGDAAGREISDLILRMAERIAALESGKVDVTPIIPHASRTVRLGADDIA